MAFIDLEDQHVEDEQHSLLLSTLHHKADLLAAPGLASTVRRRKACRSAATVYVCVALFGLGLVVTILKLSGWVEMKSSNVVQLRAVNQKFDTQWMKRRFSTVEEVALEGADGLQGIANTTATTVHQVAQEGSGELQDLVNTTAEVTQEGQTGFQGLANTTATTVHLVAQEGRGDLQDFANTTVEIAREGQGGLQDLANKSSGFDEDHLEKKLRYAVQDGWSVVGNITESSRDDLEHMRMQKQLKHAMREEWGQVGDFSQKTKDMENKINSLTGSGSSCPGLDGLYIKKVIHSNLGGHGPDEGEPSLIFESNHSHGGATLQNINFKITANSPYSPGTPWMNGLSHGLVGKYGMIVLAPGTALNFTIRLLDPETGEPIRMASLALTFFDLDEAVGHTEREFLTVGGFTKAEMTRSTEIKRSSNMDGSTTFSASTVGNFQDNPIDPLLLTMQQKNRAVTLTFSDVEEITAVIGASAGTTAVSRGFTFVGHPVLDCAETLGVTPATASDKGGNASQMWLLVAAGSSVLLVAVVCIVGLCFCCA